MTKAEAIKIINGARKYIKFEGFTANETEVFEMAIKALEQEPCEDCVSRATVLTLINDVKNADGFKDYSQYEYLFDQVDKMPMATPTRKKGKNNV